MSSAISTSCSSGSGSKNWYAELAPSEKRTFWACFGGWALDAYDVQIFSFAIPAQPWPRLTTILAARRRSAAAKSL